MKRIRYILETLIAWGVYGFFRILPMKASSFLGGIIGRAIGPRVKVSKIAIKNLQKAMPELSEKEINHIVKGMWENLGRVIGEFPHMPNLPQKLPENGLIIKGKEYLDRVRENGQGAIIFSGHFANWEVMPRIASSLGMPMVLVYRPANNKGVDTLMRISRRKSHNGMYAKGVSAARHIAKALRGGEIVGMLVDQKMNEGLAIPFFGMNAMTAPALAEMAQKYKVPILPARVVRKDGVFEVEVLPSLEIEGKTTEVIMKEVNSILEGWIREYPSQWFWLHKRWG